MLEEPLLVSAEKRGGTASISSCTINLASTCMGTGILSLPMAFHMAGFTSGAVLCVFGAALTVLSLHLLAACAARIDRPPSFFATCEAALPNSGPIIDAAVIVNCVGTAASYLIVASDCFSALGAERHAVVATATLLCSPACFFRSIDSLRITSTVAVFCLLGIGALAVLFGFGATGSSFDPCPGNSTVEHGHCGSHGAYSHAAYSAHCLRHVRRSRLASLLLAVTEGSKSLLYFDVAL